MNPTIPNVEGSILENLAGSNNSVEASRDKSSENNTGANPNTFQDVESRESKTGPSGGAQQQDDDSDAARKQLATIGDDQSSLSGGYSQTTVVVNDSDDDTAAQADSTFVHKVEEIVSQTKGEPEVRVNKMAHLQAEFILKRFNHQIRTPKSEGREA